MKVLLTRRASLLSAVSAAVVCFAGVPALAEDPIKIGFIGSLSGPSSKSGDAITRGLSIAIDEINASGGLLDYRSYSPRHKPMAKLETQLGGFGLRRLHGAFSQQHDGTAFAAIHQGACQGP